MPLHRYTVRRARARPLHTEKLFNAISRHPSPAREEDWYKGAAGMQAATSSSASSASSEAARQLTSEFVIRRGRQKLDAYVQAVNDRKILFCDETLKSLIEYMKPWDVPLWEIRVIISTMPPPSPSIIFIGLTLTYKCNRSTSSVDLSEYQRPRRNHQ